jgi:sugar lactone lactonase YvrE
MSDMVLPVRPAAVVGDRCGEGAVWCEEESAVYWTDINRFLVHRLTWPERCITTWHFEEPPTALALSMETGRLLLALASKLIWWWPRTDRRADHGFRLASYPEARLNDGRADPTGCFWIGSMYNNVTRHGGETDENWACDRGQLFRIGLDGKVTEKLRGIGIANTLCWDATKARFYFADTMKNDIGCYSFDAATGDITFAGTHLAGYERGWPDGSAIDCQGYLWNCRWDGGGIVRIAPNGDVVAFHPIPTRNVTTCVFGGADLTSLFITSARNPSDPGDRLAGSLWVLDAGIAGLPESRVVIPA